MYSFVLAAVGTFMRIFRLLILSGANFCPSNKILHLDIRAKRNEAIGLNKDIGTHSQ
jgi:hypothetical protein